MNTELFEFPAWTFLRLFIVPALIIIMLRSKFEKKQFQIIVFLKCNLFYQVEQGVPKHGIKFDLVVFVFGEKQ